MQDSSEQRYTVLVDKKSVPNPLTQGLRNEKIEQESTEVGIDGILRGKNRGYTIFIKKRKKKKWRYSCEDYLTCLGRVVCEILLGEIEIMDHVYSNTRRQGGVGSLKTLLNGN